MQVVVDPQTKRLIRVNSAAYAKLPNASRLRRYDVSPAVARARKVYVVNPRTGRQVRVGSQTFMEMQKRARRMSGRSFTTASAKKSAKRSVKKSAKRSVKRPAKRSVKKSAKRSVKKSAKRSAKKRKSATRGWRNAAPRPGAQRRSLYKRCGSKCFLMPSKRKFPVCAARSTKCKVDCRGVQAAYNRARQYKYSGVASRARKILDTRCSAKKK